MGGHGRLRPSLRAFHALLRRGLLAFEWGGGGLNTLLDRPQCTFNLGAGRGIRRARKLGYALHIITGSLHDARTISINDAHHMVNETGTHWDHARAYRKGNLDAPPLASRCSRFENHKTNHPFGIPYANRGENQK